MAVNEKKICENYADGREDTRVISSRAQSLEFHYTKKLLREYIHNSSHVIEIGCATGYYGIYFADKCANYMGVDLSPVNISLFNDKIQRAALNHITAAIGDATDLKNIPDNSFDVVLCLGPMYHLPPHERELVFAECKRIAKKGAVIAFAYISPLGAYIKAVLTWPEYYPNEKANESVLKNGIDDNKPDVFFFATPEHISEKAQTHGLTVLKNAGTDFTFNDKLINEMSEEQFASYMTLSDYMVESESCAGLANHGILICKK